MSSSDKLLQSFAAHMETSSLPSRRRAGASPRTIKGYKQDASIFLRWWRQSFGCDLTLSLLRKDPFQLNKKIVQDFLACEPTAHT
jgi:hypothetical protein